jgi:hypothetical protein
MLGKIINGSGALMLGAGVAAAVVLMVGTAGAPEKGATIARDGRHCSSCAGTGPPPTAGGVRHHRCWRCEAPPLLEM